jgi:hypothetical protein
MKKSNIREISKKEKFYGITMNSWKLSMLFPIIFIPSLGIIYAFLIALCVCTTLFLLETFFDEDIIDFVFVKMKTKILPSKFYS